MLPARNKRDYDDIPKSARDNLEFIWLERVDEAIAAALEPAEAKVEAAEGKGVKGLLARAKKSQRAQRLRQLLDRAIDWVRDGLAPEPRLQPVPVRVKR